MVQLHLRALETWCNGPIRALATAGIFGTKVTGIVDATDLETTAAYEGCGQGPRKRKLTDTHGKGPAIEVTVYGWKPSVLIDALTTMPLAVKVGPSHAHAVLARRVLVTQARTNRAGDGRRHTVVFDQGVWEGVAL